MKRVEYDPRPLTPMVFPKKIQLFLIFQIVQRVMCQNNIDHFFSFPIPEKRHQPWNMEKLFSGKTNLKQNQFNILYQTSVKTSTNAPVFFVFLLRLAICLFYRILL